MRKHKRKAKGNVVIIVDSHFNLPVFMGPIVVPLIDMSKILENKEDKNKDIQEKNQDDG